MAWYKCIETNQYDGLGVYTAPYFYNFVGAVPPVEFFELAPALHGEGISNRDTLFDGGRDNDGNTVIYDDLKWIGDHTFSGDISGIPVAYGLACSDETTDLAVGTAKATFRIPHAMTVKDVRASVTTAPAGSALSIDVNSGGVSILSTKITIEATEKTSTTATTPPVISSATLADDSEISVDIDAIGLVTAGAGLKVWLVGTIG